jgi:hypothetical protein
MDRGFWVFILVLLSVVPTRAFEPRKVAAKELKGDLAANLFVEFVTPATAKLVPKAEGKASVWAVAAAKKTDTFVSFDFSRDWELMAEFDIMDGPAHLLFFASGGQPLRVRLDSPDFTTALMIELAGMERSDATKRLKAVQQAGVQRAEDALQHSNDGVVELTTGSWEKVLDTVFDIHKQQVVVLYYGSFTQCSAEKTMLKEAAGMLEAKNALVTADNPVVTLAQVNCDVHRKPCEQASVAAYCGVNIFVSARSHSISIYLHHKPLHMYTCMHLLPAPSLLMLWGLGLFTIFLVDSQHYVPWESWIATRRCRLLWR